MTVRPVSESPGARALAEGVTATVGPHAEQQPSSRRAPHRLQREVPIKTHFIRVQLQWLTDVDVVGRATWMRRCRAQNSNSAVWRSSRVRVTREWPRLAS